MWLFLAALSMLFASGLVLYFLIRANSIVWPPAGIPPLPVGMWFSTLALLGSSATMHAAVASGRVGQWRACSTWALATLCLGLLFLGLQVSNWLALFRSGLVNNSLFASLFYFMTVLHGLHVVGGVVGLAVTAFNSAAKRFTVERHTQLKLSAMYWHFLDAVWIVLFLVLRITAWPV